MIESCGTLLDFNPTLVRLGHVKFLETEPLSDAFQSYLSSIGTVVNVHDYQRFTEFQSYLSSIGTTSPATTVNPETDFNPTLVRLGLGQRYLATYAIRISILP